MSSSTDAPDDFQTAVIHKTRRDRQLSWTLVQLTGIVVCSWIVGAASDLSVAWKLLGLVALVAMVAGVWRASLVELVDDIVHYETLRVRRRRALQQDESAEWFNFLLNRWWVFSSQSLFTIVKERLEPLLNEAKPAMVESLELRQFTLGNQTPFVRSVRVFDISHGKRQIQSARSLQFPPSGLAVNVRHQVALEADISLDSDDFRMVLRTRLFGKGMGMDLDLAMEKLNINGKLYATCTLNMEAPFPHVTHLSLTFLEKPEVWFSIRILKAVQMMAVPLLKSWIHSFVMDALITSLVDPGKLDLNLTSHDRPAPGQEVGNPDAQGVLTITLSIQNTGNMSEDVRWLVLTLGGQRCVTSHLSSRWQESPSFLISSLLTDRLMIKFKSKRIVSSITLTQFELQLANYNFENSHVVETVLNRKMSRSGSSNIPNIAVRMEYTPLPIIQLDQPEFDEGVASANAVSGVMFVYVHGAVGLTSSEHSDCNPYCMIFNNRKKVKTTHYLRNSNCPQWESRTQFLVTDRSQVALSFVVCSWSPNKMADTDLLGLAILNLGLDDRCVVRRQLTLSGNTNSNPASITVSVVFRSVASVAQSEVTYREVGTPPGGDDDEASPFNRTKRGSNSWMQQAKMLLIRDQETTSDISSLLSNGLGLMEVTLIRARELVAKDLNGFSDPYCEVKVNGECKYKSSVRKKTLNPSWEESAVMGLPRVGETLDVVLWDHDTFGMKDYLGSVTFSLDDIRRISNLDNVQCCQLQGVKTGFVELRVKVISEEAESNNSSTTSPRVQRRNEVSEGSLARRSSTERSKSRFHNMDLVPPPTPPRTVTLGYKLQTSQQDLGNYSSRSSSPHTVPTVTVTDLHHDKTDNGQISPSSLSPSYDGGSKKMTEYSSFRVMKQKVKNGLKLRRFKSEVCVHDKSNGKAPSGNAMSFSIEPSGGGESDATELLQMSGLTHAVSQPNILHPLSRVKRPCELKVASAHRPDHYTGIEGKVIQAQGLHVARAAQIYCRVKFQNCDSPAKPTRTGHSSGKTIAKSRLLPAMPNLHFDLHFQLDHLNSFSRNSALLFEIRSASKEVVAIRIVTLHELLSASSPESNEIRTWISFSNGAQLEVEIAHNRELKKQSRKIFRSWSVHRIGKI